MSFLRGTPRVYPRVVSAYGGSDGADSTREAHARSGGEDVGAARRIGPARRRRSRAGRCLDRGGRVVSAASAAPYAPALPGRRVLSGARGTQAVVAHGALRTARRARCDGAPSDLAAAPSRHVVFEAAR